MGGSVWNDPLIAYSTWGMLGSTHTLSPGGVGSFSWLHSRMVRDDRAIAQYGAMVWSRPSPNIGLGADMYMLNMKLGVDASLAQYVVGRGHVQAQNGAQHGVGRGRALVQRRVGGECTLA
jgi:hypothetical protein